MNNKLLKNLNIETTSKTKNWNIGPYKFLLQRTLNDYHKSKSSSRRMKISALLKKELPLIDDDMLKQLYFFASNKYQTRCQHQYEHTGFQTTPSERRFIETLNKIIKSDSRFKYLQIFPNNKYSGSKMVVGCYVPDFIVFGLKKNGYDGVFIEIDGDIHVEKTPKDHFMQDCLMSLGLYPISIPNERTGDQNFILSILNDLIRKRSGSLDKQIDRCKRSIWIKTISCNLTINEIEEIILSKYCISLNLADEAAEAVKMKDCPASIKRELARL